HMQVQVEAEENQSKSTRDKYGLEYIPPEFRDHLKNRLNINDQIPDMLLFDIKDIIHEESKSSLKRQVRKKRPK
ncbi:hypothetical protein NG726_28350, partial [Pseudomonas sp. MOB-449]|nr:hypothetical protein [Pseudomonas sp. MOB-449]